MLARPSTNTGRRTGSSLGLLDPGPKPVPIGAGTHPARLAWEDLAYLGSGPDLVSRVVAQATDCSLPGVNVLLHGPPGHGQHDFALLLADRCDSEILQVVAAGLERDALRAQLLAVRRRTILVVDEAEKILGAGFGSLRSTTSREELVRLLRRVGAPVLWIADDVRGAGRWQEGLEPFIRRPFRSGVGLRANGRVYFVLSPDELNLHTFTRFFRDELGCLDALYLDGVVSRQWVPSSGEPAPIEKFGPIISVHDRRQSGAPSSQQSPMEGSAN